MSWHSDCVIPNVIANSSPRDSKHDLKSPCHTFAFTYHKRHAHLQKHAFLQVLWQFALKTHKQFIHVILQPGINMIAKSSPDDSNHDFESPCHTFNLTQQTHYAMKTSLLRQNDAILTSKWRRFDVISTLCSGGGGGLHGLISRTAFALQFKFDGSFFLLSLGSNGIITTFLHNMTATLMASNGTTARRSFHWIWITSKKLLLKYTPNIPIKGIIKGNLEGNHLGERHDDVIKWKHFPRSWPLCGEFTGHRWIPHTKASDAELWCFLLSAPELTLEQTMETPVIWDAIALLMTSS